MIAARLWKQWWPQEGYVLVQLYCAACGVVLKDYGRHQCQVDGKRAAVTGGSAGGYTVLAALTRRSGVFTYVLRAKRRMRNSSSVCCRAVPGRATMACRRWKP